MITVPFTFFATAGAISRLNAKPVFVDICGDTFNMDPSLIEQAITPRTKAIIPVHLFGQCAEMESIIATAKRHGVAVIEDACQAIGAKRHGVMAGAMGETGCFSFFPSKNLGGFGDGGMVTTRDQALHMRWPCCVCMAATCAICMSGSNQQPPRCFAGRGSPGELKYLDRWTQGRRRNAAQYERLFKEAGLNDE